MRNKFNIAGIALGAALLFCGCSSTQSMRFHVAVADIDSPNPDLKFYRVTIRAKSSNVKASLQTGFFDANAVRQLYGQVEKREVESAASAKVGSHQFIFDPATGHWRPIEESELFTVVFGADAKAIATEIKMFAESDQTGEQFGRLLAAAAGGDSFVDSIAAERISTDQKAEVQQLAQALKTKSTTDTLKDDATPDALGKVLLDAAQQTIKAIGSTATIRTDSATNGFADAEKILQNLNAKK